MKEIIILLIGVLIGYGQPRKKEDMWAIILDGNLEWGSFELKKTEEEAREYKENSPIKEDLTIIPCTISYRLREEKR